MEPPVTSGPTVERARSSRAVHRIGDVATRPLIAIIVGALVVAFWIVIVATGFDHDLQLVFGTVCAGVTVTMVFVLQHTQRREQTSVQLKLNELVRALPRADDHLIGVEASSDGELADLEQTQRDHHAAIRDDDPRPPEARP
jgi:low affinity Fe/Cu permease